MRKIGEVLRLKEECGLSNRAIARSCRISHSTVSEYLTRAETAGLHWPLPATLNEDALYARLFPEKSQAAAPAGKALPGWETVRKELKKRNVTLRLVWEEYRAEHPDGYGYSQFCELYRHYVSIPEWDVRKNAVENVRFFARVVSGGIL